MNTFLARAGSNSRLDACFLAIKQSLPCGCVQFRGACAGSTPINLPLNALKKCMNYQIYKPQIYLALWVGCSQATLKLQTIEDSNLI